MKESHKIGVAIVVAIRESAGQAVTRQNGGASRNQDAGEVGGELPRLRSNFVNGLKHYRFV
jgi:hypothetical protein